MQSETLLPCPFCGGSDIRTEDNGDFEWLKCFGCHAIGPYSEKDIENEVSLTSAWNTRANAGGNADG